MKITYITKDSRVALKDFTPGSCFHNASGTLYMATNEFINGFRTCVSVAGGFLEKCNGDFLVIPVPARVEAKGPE